MWLLGAKNALIAHNRAVNQRGLEEEILLQQRYFGSLSPPFQEKSALIQ